MKTTYEGAQFFTSFDSSIEKNLMKLRVKKAIGRFIGKPFRKDPYLEFCEALLQTSSKRTIVDVGANIGTTVIPLAKRFKEARFIAVEPHPLPAARFLQNCQLNGLSNVSLVSAAIAPKADLLKIYTCPTNSGGHRVTGFEGREEASLAVDHVTIPSLPLSVVFKEAGISYCDLLKIDVEGFEVHVLESLGEWLTPSKVGIVIAEFGPEGMRKAGKTGWDMVQLMLSKGYRCEELSTRKRISRMEEIPPIADFTVTDFIFSA